ncbi:MAG: ATP-binding protein [Spirochaetaceae bacterium]|nr:ATP-binding protein [Spirochaetaceae bacterium]
MNIVSFSPFGYEGALVIVEVDLRRGIPSCDVVGLADCAVKEARERMRAAIRNSGLDFPSERVLINLSPADLKKEGSGFDLAIALAVLQAADDGTSYNQTNEPILKKKSKVLVIGELELSGKVRQVRGTHAAILTAAEAGIKYCIIPKGLELSDSDFGNTKIFTVDTLLEAKEILTKIKEIDNQKDNLKTTSINEKNTLNFENELSEDKNSKNQKSITIDFPNFPKEMDFSAVKDQPVLTRALQIAAAGRHNLLAYGPPGCGKTLSLQRYATLLPNLSLKQSQEVTRIWSLSGLIPSNTELIKTSPFRMPHQSASLEGMVGGGTHCHPGEISLAHNGVLFLDEACEFRSSVLQTLRVPLESHSITLSRAGRHTIFPADFQLLIATNPCPCGNFGSKDKICLCSAFSVENYWKKFSGPLLDRIDIRVPVFQNLKLPRDFPKEAGIVSGTTTEELRVAIKKSQEIQLSRQGKLNSKLTPDEINFYCNLHSVLKEYLEHVSEKKDFSSRAVHSCIKLARTIADMQGSYDIKLEHLEEAVFYRKTEGPLEMF